MRRSSVSMSQTGYVALGFGWPCAPGPNRLRLARLRRRVSQDRSARALPGRIAARLLRSLRSSVVSEMGQPSPYLRTVFATLALRREGRSFSIERMVSQMAATNTMVTSDNGSTHPTTAIAVNW